MNRKNRSGATTMFIEVTSRCGTQLLVCSVNGNRSAVPTASVGHPPGVREELAAHRGAGAVRTDEQVAGGATAVIEECGDLAAVLLVMGEGLAELHRIVEAGQQQVPQSDPVDGV